MAAEPQSMHWHWNETLKLIIAFIGALSISIGGLFWLFKTSLPSAEATQALRATELLQVQYKNSAAQVQAIAVLVKELNKELQQLNITGQLSQIQASQTALWDNQVVLLNMMEKQSARMDKVFELAAERSAK